MCVNCGNTSCNECNSVISKRGLPGPQGPRGFMGPQGPQGVPGTILPENVLNAIEGANDPSSNNPFATTSDLGGYIPIPGTDVGNPVTGGIEYMDDDIETIFVDNGFTRKGILLGTDGSISFFYQNITDGLYTGSGLTLGGHTVNSNDPNFKGFQGTDYYGENYDDNTYVQKKYVDVTMIPLDYGDIVSVGGIENAQVFTTGAGTGIASVDLSPTMAIGKDVTVSDLGNNASTHNIQIDSGVGNTILYGGTASQDITLNTNGASVTIRKITATKFMVI